MLATNGSSFSRRNREEGDSGEEGTRLPPNRVAAEPAATRPGDGHRLAVRAARPRVVPKLR